MGSTEKLIFTSRVFALQAAIEEQIQLANRGDYGALDTNTSVEVRRGTHLTTKA
jgi:hypothetical protein